MKTSGLFLACSITVSAVPGSAFVFPTKQHPNRWTSSKTISSALYTSASTVFNTTATIEGNKLAIEKKKLLALLKSTEPFEDAVLADPITKESITITAKPVTFLGGESSSNNRRRIKYFIESASNKFQGTSDTFIDLLEPIKPEELTSAPDSTSSDALARNLIPFIPPPLRSAFATAGFPMGEDYVPMRDLFTSPVVSAAYERGWRQGFAQAGFPGADDEAQLAMDYFAPVMAMSDTKTLVDMSCATGLFTRRFAKSGKYARVLGCDYSASMLNEAHTRIQANPRLNGNRNTQLDLIRLDVGQIPMKNASVDCLHAGAAMHCWPDLPAAAAEIYRVLKPGGRYFATTFLSSYFGTLQQAEGGANGPSRQAFQYFESVEQLKSLLVDGGFAREMVSIEVLSPACVVIRCEKTKK
ncbi:predicted protein [Phaeodactylum tricornutum CCAP 1055/1]|uniref:Methyltransferase type 11 domain-containing protein n=1 Tax=Phaeodactylum tricornutum (strain CCAP 1055/1) TaxID=556484 RepID=B5Y3Q7_PHATC|nr:predicted protein [Phaeodactylum tricornutum CCAP 1055/1]ACI65168.1 predicted protein [Phaeodactylum tricornutum CCAP 1055/1]|eukprot:XP_002185698.1 predicted protein [Phaeodactylum tricornutum CCAP 1055/1]